MNSVPSKNEPYNINMSRIKSNNFLAGSNIPKMPSKRDIEAMVQKRKKEEQELIEKMNIPPRDEEKYPMPDEKDVKNAGALIYTLGVLAESYDKNLQALVWQYYVDLMNSLRADSTQKELFGLIGSLTNLKKYLAESKNPLFTDKVAAAAPEEK